MTSPRVIVALDYPDARSATALVDRLNPDLCRLKVGKELFTAAGPALVENLARRGYGVFLDLKYHDIPHTVAGACRAAANLGVWMINIHAAGGRAMMIAAREALAHVAARPLLIAVTVLTSMSDADLAETGIVASAKQTAMRLAHLTQECGLDGVVCSAQEASALKSECGAGFCLVTPGIRLPDAIADDQKRVMTPRRAVDAGADYLVIGRPITQAPDPIDVLRRIRAEIG